MRCSRPAVPPTNQLPPTRRALPAAAAISASAPQRERDVPTVGGNFVCRKVPAGRRAPRTARQRCGSRARRRAARSTVRASRRQIESARVAATASVASRTMAGTQNQTMPSTSPPISEVSMPEPSTATLTTASGAFCRRCAMTAITAAAIAHDSGADHTSAVARRADAGEGPGADAGVGERRRATARRRPRRRA